LEATEEVLQVDDDDVEKVWFWQGQYEAVAKLPFKILLCVEHILII
jgi:hypothetical protein